MDKKVKSRAIRRLRIIEGQIGGLERMVEQDAYCINVIHQSLAAKEALSSFENLILENHLATHVADQFRTGQKTKAVKEILSIYKLSRQK
ncbi:MAG: metal-sensitive transcriptional regulator [Candidatus Colwellbacteria bacterium]